MQTSSPLYMRNLDDRDIRGMLASNHTGRLAFCWGGRADIRPVNYVYARDRLFGRTSHGEKFVSLDALPAQVAFEVDESHGLFQWKSVVIRGLFDIVSPESARDEWEEAVGHFRRLVRESFGDRDPLPGRSLMFRIEIESATGRAMGDRRYEVV